MICAGGADKERGANQETGEKGEAEIWSEINSNLRSSLNQQYQEIPGQINNAN